MKKKGKRRREEEEEWSIGQKRREKGRAKREERGEGCEAGREKDPPRTVVSKRAFLMSREVVRLS